MNSTEPDLTETEKIAKLHRAASQGDIPTMERLIAEGVDINARPLTELGDGDYAGEGLTPLMVAALSTEGANVDTLAWLLDHGADLNALSHWDVTAVWYAAGTGDRSTIPPGEKKPGDVDRLRILLDRGGDPNETMSNGKSLLVEACEAADPARVQLLLERGASPLWETEAPAEWGFERPLFAASESGCVACIQLLLDAGVDPNEATQRGETALMSVTSPEAARLLIAAGARVDASNDYDDVLGHILQTAADEADDEAGSDEPDAHAVAKAFAVADVLLEAGAPLDGNHKYGWTRLYLTAWRHWASVVEWLLARGASHASTDDLSTPLHGVCWKGEFDMGELPDACVRTIRTLVAAGMSMEAQDKESRTPLHKAISGDGGNSYAARTLLELGAEPNPVDRYGQTPLHLATFRGELTCVEVLLAGRADPLRLDAQGYSAVDNAAAQVHYWRTYPTLDESTATSEEIAERQDMITKNLAEAEAILAVVLAASRSSQVS